MAISETPPVTLKARYVFPVDGEPIADGTVTFRAGVIEAVGDKPVDGEVRDLGNVAILPGLVNAHTHLEFSDLDRPLGKPGMGFVDWIQEVMAYRRQRAEPTWRAVAKGLDECVRFGTTAVGEIAQPGWSAEPFLHAGLNATVFLELIALAPDRVDKAINLAQQHIKAGNATAAWQAGISPHTPYTTIEPLVRAAARISAENRVPLAFHLAESKEELQLAASRSGPLREFLSNVVGPERARHLGTQSTDSLVRDLTKAHRAQVIHGNYLDERAIALLAEHSDHTAVIYCPRTHAYFGHDAYPLEKMLSAGVIVALGTDSRASSPDLSLLAEIRFAASRHPSVPRSTILRMGTQSGAIALGREQHIGSLAPGKRADLAIVRLPDRHSADPYELLFDSEKSVAATWINGVSL